MGGGGGEEEEWDGQGKEGQERREWRSHIALARFLGNNSRVSAKLILTYL